MDEIVAHNNFFVLRIRKKLQLEAYNTLPGKVLTINEICSTPNMNKRKYLEVDLKEKILYSLMINLNNH